MKQLEISPPSKFEENPPVIVNHESQIETGRVVSFKQDQISPRFTNMATKRLQHSGGLKIVRLRKKVKTSSFDDQGEIEELPPLTI